MLRAPAPVVIDRLNSLLRCELAAVAGYQSALRTLREQAVEDGNELLGLASEHQRTATALNISVEAQGGAPAAVVEPVEGWKAPALMSDDSSAMLESGEFLGALLDVERRSLAEYEAALSSLDEDALELVELELIPRQRRHVARLSARLIRLAARSGPAR